MQELPVVSIRLNIDRQLYSEQRIENPFTAVEMISKDIRDIDREVLCVLNLDTKNRPINMNVISIGTLNKTLTSTREIMKSAILSNAAGMILLHNHPSGNLEPSAADEQLTATIEQACSIMNINLLDHIIINLEGDYFSLREGRKLSGSLLREINKLENKNDRSKICSEALLNKILEAETSSPEAMSRILKNEDLDTLFQFLKENLGDEKSKLHRFLEDEIYEQLVVNDIIDPAVESGECISIGM